MSPQPPPSPAPAPRTPPSGGSPAEPGPGSARESAAAVLGRLAEPDAPPFALLRRRTPGRDQHTVEVLTGPVHEVERIADIEPGPHGALALVPYRQIRERGFTAQDDGTPLSVLVPEEVRELTLDQVLSALPDHRVRVTGGGFDVDDGAYEEMVRRVVEDEIAAGEGANFVLRRTFEARIPDVGRADALALFGRLLRGERGAYWTFVVHTGERVLAGASPEAHVRMTGGTVVMNPISGTYRHPAEGPSAEGLLDFLADRKESEELSMVVDEELKMMCTVGDMGGVVVGPRLKEMAHLTHTEYELRGRSTLDARDVLRETMFAATVTGSPLENACRVVERYENGGRGYYAGALALFGGTEEQGEPGADADGADADGAADAERADGGGGPRTLDSPILIRTADIDVATGRLRLPVGATLVRASDPASEVAETHAKAAGVLGALDDRAAPDRSQRPRPRLADDPRVAAALESRRAELAPFWLRMQAPQRPCTPLGEVLVVDGEDTFTSMLAHLLRCAGPSVTVRRYDEPGLAEEALAHEGPVVLGPGPGDPRDLADPKMRLLRSLAADLVRARRRGLLGVCLGHELLAAELGLEITRKERPYQGAQEHIDLFGRTETVGFYNSYTARCTAEAEEELTLHGVRLSRDPGSGDVHALHGPNFAGVQFHPESVLTRNGPGIVAELLAAVAEPV